MNSKSSMLVIWTPEYTLERIHHLDFDPLAELRELEKLVRSFLVHFELSTSRTLCGTKTMDVVRFLPLHASASVEDFKALMKRLERKKETE